MSGSKYINISIHSYNFNFNFKKGKKLVGWETLKRVVELQFLICICMFFQWMRCLTRTAGYYLGLLNIMTFRKKTWLNQLRQMKIIWVDRDINKKKGKNALAEKR